ncbi:MGMT family protein [Anaerovorax odorimutans]|uniref:MGMT family protein n=1 Tax=Anaerovorax odorimutans TaxID=109327 RepID=A0ABT1RSY6_9FIRM|nr:MGMT family protein [Anaerovorax odorimutans]MCQ4638251.1 MGMT family protein [Anaerovorax odorimutans]
MKNMFEQVYAIVARIPSGRVTTYGQIARMLGNPRLSRAVGYALHVSPDGLPCHRVVDRNGKLADSFFHDGINEQRLLLEEEGVAFTEEGRVALESCMWYGDSDK